MKLLYIDDVGDLLVTIVNIATKSDVVIDSINLINRNKEMFYDVTCKVKNITSLHNFIDEINQLNNVRDVERIFI